MVPLPPPSPPPPSPLPLTMATMTMTIRSTCAAIAGHFGWSLAPPKQRTAWMKSFNQSDGHKFQYNTFGLHIYLFAILLACPLHTQTFERCNICVLFIYWISLWNSQHFECHCHTKWNLSNLSKFCVFVCGHFYFRSVWLFLYVGMILNYSFVYLYLYFYLKWEIKRLFGHNKFTIGEWHAQTMQKI